MTRNIKSIRCPVCDSDDLLPMFRKEVMPAYNLEKHYSRDSALNARTGSIDFHFCKNCLFTFNPAVELSDRYNLLDYESSRSHSKYFNQYLESVCRDINEVFDISNKVVVEIGCGDGDFLKKLKEKYVFKGYGFDPCLNINEIEKSPSDLEFIRGYYDYSSLKNSPEIIIIRHLLEHIPRPYSFLDKIIPASDTKSIGIYIEIPGWEWIVENNSIYAFSYEHCSYYSKHSIDVCLQQHKFLTKKISNTFNDEYIQYYGVNHYTPNTMQSIMKSSDQQILENSLSFKYLISKIIKKLRIQFTDILHEAVLWGAAGKGTTFLNLLDLTYKQLEYVVDSNPSRQNTFIPITGQQIVSPNYLIKLKPKYILITNSNYYNEFKTQISDLNLKSEIIPIDKIIGEL